MSTTFKVGFILGAELGSKFNKNFTHASKSVTKLNKNISKSSSLMKKNNKMIRGACSGIVKSLGGLGAAFAGIKGLTGTIKKSREFKDEMEDVATLLDGNVDKKINNMSKDVKKLSVDLGVSTNLLTKGAYQTVSAFGDQADSMERLKVASKGAIAGNAEVKDSINLLSGITKGYGDTSLKAMEKASDLAFMTVKLGQTEFPELASNMGKVVPLAGTLKVKQEELFGAMATLTGVTGNTAEVSTQLKSTFQAFLKPSADMEKAIKSLGYKNAATAMQTEGLGTILGELKDHVNGNEVAFANLFGSVEAKNAVLALTGAQAENFTQKTLAMNKAAGATEKAFLIKKDPIDRLKQLGNVAMISIGEKLLPFVEKAADYIVNFSSKSGPYIKKVGQYINTFKNGAVKAFNKTKQIVMPIINVFKKEFKETFERRLQLGKNMIASMAGIFNKVRPHIQVFINNFVEAGKKIIPVVGKMVRSIDNCFQKIYPIFMKIIGYLVENLLPIFNKVFGFIAKTIIPQVINVFSYLATKAGAVFGKIGQLIIALKPVFDAFLGAVKFVMPAVGFLVTNVIGGIKSVIRGLLTTFGGIIDFITGVFTGNWSKAWGGIKDIFGGIFESLGGLVKTPLNIVISIINGAINGINKIGFKIPDWVPFIGGKDFKVNIPKLPLLARGGFTNGPSIAGEAGTESVIPIKKNNPRSIMLWKQTGEKLGLLNQRNGNTYVFAPKVQGNTSQEVRKEMLTLYEKFKEMIERYEDDKGRESYA